VVCTCVLCSCEVGVWVFMNLCGVCLICVVCVFSVCVSSWCVWCIDLVFS